MAAHVLEALNHIKKLRAFVKEIESECRNELTRGELQGFSDDGPHARHWRKFQQCALELLTSTEVCAEVGETMGHRFAHTFVVLRVIEVKSNLESPVIDASLIEQNAWPSEYDDVATQVVHVATKRIDPPEDIG